MHQLFLSRRGRYWPPNPFSPSPHTASHWFIAFKHTPDNALNAIILPYVNKNYFTHDFEFYFFTLSIPTVEELSFDIILTQLSELKILA